MYLPKRVVDRELRAQCRHWIVWYCKETNISRHGFPNHGPRDVFGQPVCTMRPAVTFEKYEHLCIQHKDYTII
jgi:hypothetical protein